jgi:hypothetical protein
VYDLEVFGEERRKRLGRVGFGIGACRASAGLKLWLVELRGPELRVFGGSGTRHDVGTVKSGDSCQAGLVEGCLEIYEDGEILSNFFSIAGVLVT